jgi:hypothetical protein
MANFFQHRSLFCVDSKVALLERRTLLVTSEIVCIAPPLRPGNVTMEISYNGVDFVSTSPMFTSSDVAVFGSLYPSAVLTSGGTSVTVSGSGFDDSILCLFGSLMIPSKFVSGTFVTCISPQMP